MYVIFARHSPHFPHSLSLSHTHTHKHKKTCMQLTKMMCSIDAKLECNQFCVYFKVLSASKGQFPNPIYAVTHNAFTCTCMSTVNYKFMSPFLSLSLCPFSHYILVPVLYVNDLNHLTANSSKSKCDDTGLNSAMFLKFFI